MVKGKKMRYNPYWYQGLDFVEEDPKFSNVDEDINMNGHAIINLKYPANENDAASKKYVDDAIAAGGGGPGGGPLLASQIQSVATAQIQALNVQEAINEISAEGAFLDSPNVFSQVNTFNQVPKLAAGVNVPSTDPQALTTVAKVNSLIAAIKAAGVAVDQSTPLTNLTGPDVQAVIKQTDTILSQLKSNLHLVGTYDVAQDKVLEAFGTAGSGNITANAVLPVPSADNKNMYLLVKVGGTGTGNAIAVQFDPGDIIYSSGTSWRRAFTAISRAPLTAANVSSVATQQIKGTNVQAVIDELSTRAAFKDLDNTFTKVVKLAPGVTPTDPQDLATVAKVDAALGALKASGVTVDPAVPPLNNLTGANVQEVIEQADDLFDELSEMIVANTSLVGLYNAKNNTVTKRFIGDIGGQPAGGIAEGKALPAADDTNKNMYLYIHEEGTGTGEAPSEPLKVGDLVISDGARWNKVSLSRVINASQVSITAIAGAAGANVQEVLESLNNKDNSLQNDLLVKTTFIGTYNAATNKIASVNASIKAKFPEYVVGRDLPAHNAKFINHILYITTDGTGAAPLPTEAFHAGDVIYNSGAGWEVVVFRTTISASNVGITAIPQLPNANNVQEALQAISVKAPTAVEVSVAQNGGLTDTNVQAALETLQTNKAAKSEVVTLDTAQTINGKKTIKDPIFVKSKSNGEVFTLVGPEAEQVYFDWRSTDTSGQYAYVGFASGNTPVFSFSNSKNIQGQTTRFEFNKVIRYPASVTITDNQDLVTKAYVDGKGGDYVTKANGQITSDLNANQNRITNLMDPMDPQDAATKAYAEDTYVKKIGGQLGGDLDAGKKKIVNLATPVGNQDAATKAYVDGKGADYVTKTNGVLDGVLDAQNNTISNLPEPQELHHAANKDYVDKTFVKQIGGRLGGDLDAVQHKIVNLANGAADGDAVNLKQLQDTFGTLQSQLVGKLTFIGTYDAAQNQIASLNPVIKFPEYVVGSALPADKVKFANHFFIVTVAGTGTAPAPAEALTIGDMIYSPGVDGGNWGRIPIGVTAAAQNVSVDPITELPGSTNVQAALQALAVKVPTNITAAGTSFQPVGGIAATNVQEALRELDSETVKLTGNQTIAGTKTFSSLKLVIPPRNVAFQMFCDKNHVGYFEWKHNERDPYYAYVGFGSSAAGSQGIFSFINDKNIAGNPSRFEFNKIIRYAAGANPPAITDNSDVVHKQYVDTTFVTLDTEQTITGSKTFGGEILAGSGGTTFKLSPESDTTKTMSFSNAAKGANCFFNLDLERKSKLTGLVDPATDYDAATKKYVDDRIAAGGGGGGAGGTAAGTTFAPDGGLASTNVQDAIVELSDQAVKLTGDQTVEGKKIFTAPEFDRDRDGIGFTVRSNYISNNYVRWYDTGRKRVLAYIGYGTSRNRAQFQFVNDMTFVGGHTAIFTFNKIVRYDTGSNPPTLTDDDDFAHKKYVDDAVALAPKVERVSNVDVTAAIASLAGKGTMTFSYMLTRDAVSRDVISSIFGMKLTLTAPWNPGDATTPVELPGCQIAGEEYFKGLPIPSDPTLQGGVFKTVGQIGLIRVVPNGGVNMPQSDSPLMIGRIVCAISGGNTKLYAVFKHNADVSVPTGTGAFFTVRYEGLPTMVI